MLCMASDTCQKRGIDQKSLDLEDIQLDSNWDDVTCPICLDSPHNGVLLQCSSYDKGCRPFMCDTDHTHSNCLSRFKSAYGLSAIAKVSSIPNGTYLESIQEIPSSPDSRPTCPLCRGEVIGRVIIDEARLHLNMKKRCCQEKHCPYVGNYFELQKHTQLKHPHSRPSEIDPARQLDWENFQQSSDIIDVLSTIHAEVPHGVVLGDYVIEYGDEEAGDEYENFHRNRRKWWTSCILFANFRASRNRQRSGRSERRSERRSSRQSSSDGSNLDEGSVRSADIREYRFDDDEYPGAASGGAAASRRIPSHYRYGRRRSHFFDP